MTSHGIPPHRAGAGGGGAQLANARRVERLGVGVAVMPSELSAATVRAAIARLVAEPSFADRARSLKSAVRGVDGTRRAVEAILTLAARA